MLKLNALYDYILLVLYELKKQDKLYAFSLNDILKTLNNPLSASEQYNVAKYIEVEGYAKVDYSIGGIFLTLTTSGVAYIERQDNELETTFSNFIADKHIQINADNILHYKDAMPDGNKIAVRQIAKNNVLLRIGNIIKLLKRSKYTKNSDLVKDAEILKIEVEKQKPDKEIVILKIENLDHLGHLDQLVQQTAELKTFFNYEEWNSN